LYSRQILDKVEWFIDQRELPLGFVSQSPNINNFGKDSSTSSEIYDDVRPPLKNFTKLHNYPTYDLLVYSKFYKVPL
jgi:hypothetical protein